VKFRPEQKMALTPYEMGWWPASNILLSGESVIAHGAVSHSFDAFVLPLYLTSPFR
jgi:hypothetical protein